MTKRNLDVGQVWLATLSREPDLRFTIEIVAKVDLWGEPRWLGIKHLGRDALLKFPGNQMYLFGRDGVSEGDAFSDTVFTLYAKSKTPRLYACT